MSRPRFDWWSNAVNMVRNYPARKAEYEDLHTKTISAQISGMPRSSDISRSTESIALKEMPPAKQREYDAVTDAIRITMMYPNGDIRVELISRVYWKHKKTQSIKDVVAGLYISEATGKRWHAAFIRLVGDCFGYEI